MRIETDVLERSYLLQDLISPFPVQRGMLDHEHFQFSFQEQSDCPQISALIEAYVNQGQQ